VLTFPRSIAGREFTDAPSLAAAVQADAAAGGSTVVDGARPAEWLAGALQEQEIDRELLVALCAALIRGASPPSVVEAAEVARSQDLHELAPVLQAAVAGLDVGVLLFPDPRRPNGSVEDALLTAWGAVEPGEAGRTMALLDRLRNAGLRAVELDVLSRLGSAETVRLRLPPILVEDLPVEDVASLAQALARGGDVAQAVCDAAEPLTASQRYSIWRAAEARAPALGSDDALRARWLVVEGSEAAGTVG